MDRSFDCDHLIIGSGFGGSVAALRLVEKGYSVRVLEAGPRFRDQDFPRTNWRLSRFLFMPRVGLRGIMRMDFLKGLMVMSGAGVGGGSLVYANTLIEPKPAAFGDGSWPVGLGVGDWGSELKRYYDVARLMLGVARAPVNFPAERALAAAAREMGYGDTFQPVDVGIYFGTPGVEAPDPYFGGEGPARRGCTMCGGCMIGCRNNAKNTLVKNYLFFAEKRGAVVEADADVRWLKPLAGGGFEVGYGRPGIIGGRTRVLRAKNVVLAAGVLGTLRLLLRCRDELGTMPALSDMLGRNVRTNSEAILGVRSAGTGEDFSRGIAIAAGVSPNAHTKIEAVRYPLGADAMALLSAPFVEGNTIFKRLLGFTRIVATEPWRVLRGYWPLRFAKETVILLVMQSLDSRLRLIWKKGLFGRITTDTSGGTAPPRQIPEGNAFAEALARATNGVAGGSVADLMGMNVTAHILGGCPMGRDASTGVIDTRHEVFGYPGLFVVGGAAVPANLGVNPSLTITAMAERAMSHIAAKSETRIDQAA